MARLQSFDDVFYNAQRQGRVSFYMQHAGEEAAIVGSAAALEPSDVIFSQYREAGALFWRGFTVQQAADQCASNEDDLGKGRQMPVHYGSAEHNFQTISSPLATQIPQAAGAAYALKLTPNNKSVVLCYFGEGAASEGDFHAGMNFAATTQSPCIFFCRNNGYAISTPTKDQYRGDGIISRAAGYGMCAIRVDGNDIFAVHRATQEARKIALTENKPVFIEVMSYRRGHHSTSDDSTRYRSVNEINEWIDLCPVRRLRRYMEDREWWNNDLETALREEERREVMKALESAEKKNYPPPSELFTDVYDVLPPHLEKQQKELQEHMAKYPDHLPHLDIKF
eukprot:CAMPEP_0174821456 /NCGR_PEP_ID=MMETSP1107-20130205/8268_1 /TAXON_ID=36770 /ORGANISM="Paraphysomonas vestita, Strain GFlagA" /LENGTH=337 /DNA_ID=CAMNT_0016038499 /DNA_START=210 /DNA_END=1221 /DNA_ORIENTATION=+